MHVHVMDALGRALDLLLTKGSEGDGELHLDAVSTHALAEYVRRLQREAIQSAPTFHLYPKCGICGVNHDPTVGYCAPGNYTVFYR